jgi:D-aspartate ligase
VTRLFSGVRSHAIQADPGIPALIVKIGRYPIHAGGLGAARTLGRLGVAVHVITEDPLTPLALSRYRARRFHWPTTGTEQTGELIAGLAEIGRRIGQRSVAIPTDDEAAILLAEHADELSEHILVPSAEPGLYRQLASKQQLFLLCRENDVPAPETALLSCREDLLAYAAQATFPLVLKNADPWVRLSSPMVGGTRVIHSESELQSIANSGHEHFRLLVQEYIPAEHAQDWFVHAYCNANSDCLALFTGLKVRSWPLNGGVTACGYAIPNPVLSDLAERFFKAIGYQGIADLDLRFDQRDGRYKLVDFNPRVGAQFALFRTSSGMDVVRALYLDLTSQNMPTGEQVDGCRMLVEPFDLAARFASRKSASAVSVPYEGEVTTMLAFAASDDPVPFLAVWPRPIWPLLARLAQLIRRLMRPRTAG